MRDRPLHQGWRSLHCGEAEGRDPLGRPRIGDQRCLAANPAGDLRGRRARLRHLLRPADHGGPARRRGRGRAPCRVWPRRDRNPGRLSPVQGRLACGRALPGLDEPRRPGHEAARRLHHRGDLQECALRCGGGRIAELLRGAVPPGGGAHAPRRPPHPQLRARHRRLHRRLDHGRLPRGGDRQDPRAGRHRARDLRPLGRRRFLGGGGADPRGDRRAADLRLRRSWPSAPRRGRGGRAAVSRPLQYSARPRSGAGDVPRCARGRQRP